MEPLACTHKAGGREERLGFSLAQEPCGPVECMWDRASTLQEPKPPIQSWPLTLQDTSTNLIIVTLMITGTPRFSSIITGTAQWAVNLMMEMQELRATL